MGDLLKDRQKWMTW